MRHLLLLSFVLALAVPAFANPVSMEMGFAADVQREKGSATLHFLSMRKAEEMKNLVLLAKDGKEWRVVSVKWTTGEVTRKETGGSGVLVYHRIAAEVTLGDKPVEYHLGFLDPDDFQWKIEDGKLVPKNDYAKKLLEDGASPFFTATLQPITVPAKSETDPKKASAVLATVLVAFAAARLRRRRPVAA